MGTLRALGMDENTDPILSEMCIYRLFVTAHLVHFLAYPELSVKTSMLCVTNPPYFAT